MRALHGDRVRRALADFEDAVQPMLEARATADVDRRYGRVHLEVRGLRLTVAATGQGVLEHPRVVVAHESCGADDARWIATRPFRPLALADAYDRLLDALPAPPARVPLDDALRAFGPDGDTLRPWARAFARHYKQPIRAVDLGAARPSLLFPAVATGQNLFLRAPEHFAFARMQAYLNDRGFAVVDGLLRVVPLPRDHHAPAGGLHPRLMLRAPVLVAPGRWARSVTSGTLPINVLGWPRHHGPAGRLAAWSTKLHPEMDAMWNTHFCALGHDMSLHAFAMHRLDAEAWSLIRHGLRAALRLGRDRDAANFLEGTMTRHCVNVWNRVRSAEAFDDAFAAELPALLAQIPVPPGSMPDFPSVSNA